MLEKHSILIVDDDPGVRRTLTDILEATGYAPVAVANGRESLKAIQVAPPVVALIDLKLQDIPGLELMRQIKAQSPDTECILLTGHASQQSAIQAINIGAFSYLQKPYDVDQLLLATRRAIEKREARLALCQLNADLKRRNQELLELHAISQRQLNELRVLHGVAMTGIETADEDELLARATEVIGEAL